MSSNQETDAPSCALNNITKPKDIVSAKKNGKLRVELLFNDSFSIPGIILEFSNGFVTFKATRTKKLYLVPCNHIRCVPDICPDSNYQKGDKIEAYIFDNGKKIYAWARSTVIKIMNISEYVVVLENTSALYVVNKEEIRPITDIKYLNLFTFEILMPPKLQAFASDVLVHKSFRKAIGYPYMTYNCIKNALVIHSCSSDCESVARMLEETHFKNLTQIMLLTHGIDELEKTFQKMKSDTFAEQFQVDANLIQHAIGQNGKNIKEAEAIPGVTFITVLKDTNTVKIYAETKDALEKACMLLKLKKESINIPIKLISKVIGKNANKIQGIVDESQLRHIVINQNENADSEFVELQLIGSSTSIVHAKLLLNYQMDNVEKMQQMIKYNNQSCDTEIKKKMTPAPLVDNTQLSKTLVRVVCRRPYEVSEKTDNNATQKIVTTESIKLPRMQSQIFYNKSSLQSKRGNPIRGSRESSCREPESRGGRFDSKNTQSYQGDSDSENMTDDTREDTNVSLSSNKSREILIVKDASTGHVKDDLQNSRKEETTNRVEPEEKMQQAEAIEDDNSWVGKRWRNRNDF